MDKLYTPYPDGYCAYEIMEILGKEESLARIRKGIEMLSEAADEE